MRVTARPNRRDPASPVPRPGIIPAVPLFMVCCGRKVGSSPPRDWSSRYWRSRSCSCSQRRKLRLPIRSGSPALPADAVESAACAYLSGVVVLGLLTQLLTAWWWVDSITSLAIVLLLVKEGREACVARNAKQPDRDRQCRYDTHHPALAAYRCSSGRASRRAISCATMKPGASTGRMPAKVSVSDRAMVTAGLAKEVEAVNQ